MEGRWFWVSSVGGFAYDSLYPQSSDDYRTLIIDKHRIRTLKGGEFILDEKYTTDKKLIKKWSTYKGGKDSKIFWDKEFQKLEDEKERLLNESEFKKLFPHWAYDNESLIQNWNKGKAIFETDFDTEKSKEITLKRIKNWESGTYLISLETKDKFGQDVKDQAYTFLYSDSDKTVADNNLFDASLDKTEYQPNGNAKLTFGTSAKAITVTIDIEKKVLFSVCLCADPRRQ